MSPRNHGLPVCQHVDLGAELQRVREQLMNALMTIQQGYSRTSRVARQGERALRELDELRNQLDNASAAEHPGDADWSPQIYYGADREARGWELAPIIAHHQADGPPCCT
jgi:hypothetical protein